MTCLPSSNWRSIVSLTFVDSALRSWKACDSSEASVCSLDWNGNAMTAASTHAAITTHFERRPAASRAIASIRRRIKAFF